MTIWHPMKDVPKDIPVLLKVASVRGEIELDGPHIWEKRGTWPPRWYRCRDGAELMTLATAWAYADLLSEA